MVFSEQFNLGLTVTGSRIDLPVQGPGGDRPNRFLPGGQVDALGAGTAFYQHIVFTHLF